MAAFPGAVHRPERFKPVFDDLRSGTGRVHFIDDGDSNQQQLTSRGHWADSLGVWRSRYQQYGSRIENGDSGVGAKYAGTVLSGAAGYIDGGFYEGTSSNTAIPNGLRMASSNTDGANGSNVIRFDNSGPCRIRPYVVGPPELGVSPAGGGNVAGNAPLTVIVPEAGDSNAPSLNLVAGGGVAAYSYLIPPTSGGTLNMDVRLVGGAYTSLGSATHSTKNDAVVDAILAFAANASTLPRLVQPNQIFVNRSTGELFLWGFQFLRAGITGRTGGPGGVAWSRRWCNGSQGLANMAHDLRAQSNLALGELARQAYRFAGRVVFRLKHMGNDINMAAVGSVNSAGTITGVASNTKAGFKNNFDYWARRTYESAIAAGVPADRIHLLAGAYHRRIVGSGYDAQAEYAEACREIAESGSDWGDRVTVVDGWQMRTFEEINALSWLTDAAHLNGAGYIGFNTDEHDSLFAAAFPRTGTPGLGVGAIRIGL